LSVRKIELNESQPVFNFGIFGNAGNFGNHEISWLK